ncbi:MAG: anti-phage-associated DUF1156 domain-containing protein [Chloroflexota bacterium]
MGETNPSLANAPSFMEQQFPVAKVSMESYAERRANQGQSITSLGKWWGRKPLVLVRAALLGLLLPISDDPTKDREIFLKIMTMDREGLQQRKSKPIAQSRLLTELSSLPPNTQHRFLDDSEEQPQLKRLDRGEKDELQRLVFERMNYAEKIEYCDRPEQIEGPTPEAWNEINAHLGTKSYNLNELVRELGEKRFGHTPRVGDAFCGGGSIPFESARLGSDVYAADLNPVASLLTWAALNVIGGQDSDEAEISQKLVYEAVDQQILEWGIENNSLGWRADAYLYCTEVIDPETGWFVPLASSWVIAPNTKTIARLVPDNKFKRYEIEIVENVSDEEFEVAQRGTIKDSRIVHSKGSLPAPIDTVRRGMRQWEAVDIAPRPDDVFQERLYCIRWEETFIDEKGQTKTRRHYRSVTIEDIRREEKILELLHERLNGWQNKGFIPTRKIESGDETARLQRERGWTYWHHLFTPRQLLIIGLLQEQAAKSHNIKAQVVNLLAIGRYADWNSKLCRWGTGASRQSIAQTFSNQALNTLFSFANKAYRLSGGTWFINARENIRPFNSKVIPVDCRQTQATCDIWITDPPYADAVNYHELTEYFLAWYDKRLVDIFPKWYSDSKRALAVKGSDLDFRRAMIDCYRRLTEKMPENGCQIVMFTHQEPAVWADLTLTLWAAGLRVTAAWTIQTEREATGTRDGNYVQGTVLLVLRKRIDSEPLFLDEVNQKVESEVRRQLDEMTQMEDNSDPNFGDSDYQLAAYAAALRVLTSQPIEEINPEKEILRPRKPGETGPVEALIRRAVKIACDHLVPRTLDGELWKQLNPAERFYLKGLEVESHGEYRSGVYQELARGFGANDYTELLESGKANETRLKSASEFGKKGLSGDGFAGSLVRQCLFAVAQVSKSDETREGLNYLKTELPDYWASREKISHILVYLAALRNVSTLAQWHKDAASAGLLLGAVRNDHV